METSGTQPPFIPEEDLRCLEAYYVRIGKDWDNIESAFSEVGGSLSQAIHEEATSLGGEDLAAEVAEVASYKSTLPNPEALRLLQARYPDDPEIAARVMARMTAIQSEKHRLSNKQHLRGLGWAMVRGFGSILDIFPVRRRQ